MKHLSLTLILLIILSYNLMSQIYGLSSTKITTLSAEILNKKSFEFEPGVSYQWASKYYNDKSRLIPLSPNNDSTLIINSIAFRFTYGIIDNLESGIMITDGSFSLGIKYRLINKDITNMSIVAGTTLANESDIVFKNSNFFGKTISIAGGLVITTNFNNLSVDYDIQYQNIRDSEHYYSNDIFLNIEMSYLFKNSIRIVSGLFHIYNFRNPIYNNNSYLLTYNIGLSIETGKMYSFSIGFPFSLIGRNYNRYNGFNFALTISLN